MHESHHETGQQLAFTFDQDAPKDTNEQGGEQSQIAESFELLDAHALTRAARVMKQGARRYKKDNWRKITDPQVHVGRAIRHLYAYLERQQQGMVSHSGEDELAHALCRVMMAMGVDPRL